MSFSVRKEHCHLARIERTSGDAGVVSRSLTRARIAGVLQRQASSSGVRCLRLGHVFDNQSIRTVAEMQGRLHRHSAAS